MKGDVNRTQKDQSRNVSLLVIRYRPFCFGYYLVLSTSSIQGYPRLPVSTVGMCQDGQGEYEHEHAGGTARRRWDWKDSDIPPDWETIPLPPDHVMKHRKPSQTVQHHPKRLSYTFLESGLSIGVVTDAHCHPTDLNITSDEYDAVKLGGIGAMATVPEDQDKVLNLGHARGWPAGEAEGSQRGRGPRVVSCFGRYRSSLSSDAG